MDFGLIARIIEFCGLEWDDRCLEYHQTRRAVQSASNWQVRQPLYSRAIGRWQNYARHLGRCRRTAKRPTPARRTWNIPAIGSGLPPRKN